MDFARLPQWNRQSPLETSTIPSIAVSQNDFSPTWSSLQGKSSLIVIDSSVPNYQELVAGIQGDAHILILDPVKDAIAQITSALLEESGISSLHLISHGASGALKLGETWLDRATLDRYQSEFKLWSQSLTADADILIYGCDVAQGEIGQSFIQHFSLLTGADIAASNNLTGNVNLNGDWTLEVQTGAIESAIAFNADIQANYQSILPVDLISVSNPTLVKGSVGLDNIGQNAVSGDGRYVVFASSASSLGANDSNGASDVFLYDRQTDSVTLISQNFSKSGSATGASLNPVISFDGNFVAFISNANNLVGSMASNTDSINNIFVWERTTGNISLVSRDDTGKSGIRASSAPSISDDGSRIAFQTQSQLLPTDSSARPDVYVWTRSTGALTHLSRNRIGTISRTVGADAPVISGDGKYVAFASLYSNLAASDTNGVQDIFLWQQETDTVINLTTSGNAASSSPVISRDGSRVAFVSDATNFATDTNGVRDVFVWTRSPENPLAGTIQLASVNATNTNSGNTIPGAIGLNLGSQNPVLSRDGQTLAFTSASTDLVAGDTNNKVDVFARDLTANTNQTVLVSQSSTGTLSDGDSGNITLSADGKRIAFTSLGTNLVSGDTNGLQDIFVRDISTGQPDSGKTFLISRTPTGGVGNNSSGTTSTGIEPSISVPIITSDGTSVVFVSQASNLNPEDVNSNFDGYIIPVATGAATLISRRNADPNTSSRTGSGDSTLAENSLSETGRYIVFTSNASELTDGDTNGVADVFLRDRQTGTTTLISKGATIANGASGNASISADGRYIVFTSEATNLGSVDNNNAIDIFWVDVQTQQLRLVSRAIDGANSANAASLNPVLSANGRYVAFTSSATNLVAGDTNGLQDVFVWDSQDNSILNITQGATGGISEQPVISPDGRYVAFVSAASNLAVGDTNGLRDVFVWDRTNSSITLVSRATGASGAISDGDSYQVSMSQDGRTIAFTSTAKNLAGTPDGDNDEDVFVRNLDTNTTVHVSVNQAGGYSVSSEFTPLRAFSPRLSGDGKFVAFTSTFTDLVATDTNGTSDVFLRDLTTNVTKLISVNLAGSDSGNNATGADGGTGSGTGTGSFATGISNDGRYVVFNSFSSNLVGNDTNTALDAFVRDVTQNLTLLASQIPAETNSGQGASFNPVISNNGGYVAFTSLATDLTPRDLNGKYDVFGLNLSTTVSLSLSKNTIAEATPTNSVQYTIRRNQTAGSLTVKLAIDNTSTVSASDYTFTAGSGITLTENGSELTIEFANGVNEGILTLSAIDDTALEDEEVLNLSVVASPDYAIADSFGTTSLKFIDNEIPIFVSITNTTQDIKEGNSGEKAFTFQVKLATPATTDPVTVRYTVQPGTADANDFTATTGILTFNVGESDTQTITVQVKGDTQFEPDETFTVELSDASANARLQTGSATATIENDDIAPTIEIVGLDSITEGQSGTQTYALTVQLNQTSSTPITVDYAAVDLGAANGKDYVLAPGQLTFAAGEQTKTINVTVNGDSIFEADEQFKIQLSNAVGAILPEAQAAKTVTITNDDTAPTLSIETVAEQSEGTTPYNFVVKLTGETEVPVTVKYATVPGTATVEDFTNVSDSLTFAAGETQKTIAIAITDDTQRERNESFSVQLSEPTNATITTASATGTITDNDPIPTVSITNVTKAEGNGGNTPFEFEVSLSNASDQEIVLNYTTEDGTALVSDNDYQTASGTIRFAPGTTKQTITVNATGDTRREQDETFSVKLNTTTPSLVTIPTDAIGLGTIQNDDLTFPSISVSPATVNEGGVLSFEVSLSDTSSDEIRIDVATSDGTALLSDSDYTRLTQTLIFAPNERTKTVTVQTTNDNKLEDDETITLTLSNPVNTTIAGTGNAIGTIKNDDQRPTIGIASTPLSEDSPTAAAYPFTIRLSNPTTQTVTVKYRTIDDTATVADNDYVATNGTITFNPGETEKTITVQAIADRKFEPTERFIVRLEDAVNADLSPTATDGLGVLNNDDAAPQLSISSRTGAQAEGDSGTTPFVFVVTLNNPSSEEIRVNYTTANGTATSPADFAATNGTLIFAPGQTEQTITVNVATDSGIDGIEPDETFFVRLSDPIGATLSSNSEAQGTILNDDNAPTPTIRIDDVIASEGNGNTTYTFKVKLLQPTTNTVTVQYRTLDGTATVADGDYTGLTAPGTLTFAPRETEKEISIVVRGDTKFEPNEDFFVELFNPTNATLSSLSTAKGVINNDDARPTISIGNVVVSEGNVDGAFTDAIFTVSLSNPSSEAITVDFTTVDGTALVSDNDYQAASGKLTFTPGVTSQQITVKVRGDRKFELDEAFSIRLSAPTNADLFTAPNQGIGTILSDDFRPTITIDGATPVLEGNSGTTPIQFKVRLSNPSSETVTVKYVTKNGTADGNDFATVSTPTTVTFAPGQTEQTITVQAIGDTQFELDETFTVELSEPSNAQIADGSATGTIINDEALPRLSIAAVPPSLAEGNSGITPFTFEVSLSEASPVPITVRYSTVDGTATITGNDYVAASGTLTFAANETKKTITVNALGDTQFEGNETFQVALSNASGATIQTGSATATITEDDTPPGGDTTDSPYDILWRNQRTGENMLWLPSGSLLEREIPFFTVPDPRWQIAGSADFDGDGDTDLLWRNPSTGETAIWQMAPDLSFRGSLLPTTDSSWEVKGIADFNRDRKPDILFRNVSTGENALWFMRDTALSSSSFITRVADTSWQIDVVADFDNDGNADIFWSNTRTGETALWFMNGTNIKSSQFLQKVPDIAWRPITSGDFNRDGFVDLFWRNQRTGENAIWFLRNGELQSSSFIQSVPPTSWQLEQVYDFNGDQSLDLLWRNTVTQEMAIWYMAREVFGAYALLPSLPDRNWAIEGVGLIGNQRKGEIILRNYQTGENRIWRVNQDVFNRTTMLETLNRDWEIQGTGDFDRNGDADIVWRNLRTRELSIWLTQNGQVREKVTVPLGWNVPTTWKILAVDDFSGDGTPDLVWRNDETGETAFWTFNGTQFSSSSSILPAMDTNWRLEGVADMNNDRSLDLIWRNPTTGEIAYWLFDRTRLTRGVINPAIDLNWQIRGFADFNRDGQTDIVWRNLVTGENGIWIMNGIQLSRSIKLENALPTWDIVGIGEYNQDNQLDLLWRDRLTGSNAVWYLNNGNFVLGAYIPSLPDPAWTVEGIDDF